MYNIHLFLFIKVGMEIYTVKATDLDRGINGQIKYSITKTISPGKNDNPFRMDEDTGKITLATPLNYEAAGEYFVTVKAEDQGPMKHYGEYVCPVCLMYVFCSF